MRITDGAVCPGVEDDGGETIVSKRFAKLQQMQWTKKGGASGVANAHPSTRRIARREPSRNGIPAFGLRRHNRKLRRARKFYALFSSEFGSPTPVGTRVVVLTTHRKLSDGPAPNDCA